jgi:spermidine synthase
MKKWTLVAKSLTPDGKPVSLEEHDGSYTLRVDGCVLMTTRQHGSEDRLAELACAHVLTKSGARVLIGGLGFGFTLQAALAALGPDSEVVVAELLPCVIEWNGNTAYPLAAASMSDPRTSVVNRDVADVIGEARDAFDGILLDVDNGPAALTLDGNGRLYDPDGLQSILTALRDGGCLALWSVAPNPSFVGLMSDAGFRVKVDHCRSRGTAGRRHTLFIGHKR